MKISRHPIAIVAALAIAGSATTPLWAFATPVREVQVQVQPIDAEFVPTSERVRSELSRLNQRLEAGRRASFYSGEASSEYLAAERFYEFGRYDEALAHARIAERALPQIPNWIEPAIASR
jgi:hypothetical protein